MPEDPWITRITITCANPALQPLWLEVEDRLRQIMARVGPDTRSATIKLKEISNALGQIRELTVDMTKPPSRRFK